MGQGLKIGFIQDHGRLWQVCQSRPHLIIQMGRRVDGIVGVTELDHEFQHMAGATADIENARGRVVNKKYINQCQQHLRIALLGEGDVAERQFQICIPQAVVQGMLACSLANTKTAEDAAQ